MRLLITTIFIFNIYVSLYAENNIAVVKSRHDKIEKVLNNFRIPFDLIKYKDLENEHTFKKYKAIYFPCGIDSPIETNINLLSRGANIKSVQLKTNFYEEKRINIIENIRLFIKDGGYAYFSGYTFNLLQEAFDVFEFFDEFPYMGMPGRIKSVLKNDLARYSQKDEMAIYMSHQGWISIKSADAAEILSEACYNTPRGQRCGPISLIVNKGGDVLYTSYHSTLRSEFRRFNTYRIAGCTLLDKINDLVFKYDQRITGRMVDSILVGEVYRMYFLNLSKGGNSIYFISDKNRYQVDILDMDMSLIESRDLNNKEEVFDIESKRDGFCYVKVYPSTKKRFGMFSVVSARGMRIFPYFMKILFSIAFLIGVAAIVLIIRLAIGRRSSGKVSRYL